MWQRIAQARRSLPDVFWYVWLGTLVNRAGGFVMPMLGYYLTDERGLGRDTAVAIATCHGAGAVVAGLVGGIAADRIGRRATMLVALLGGAVMMLCLAAARAPVAIGAAAAGLGLVGELYRPAVMAFVADVVPPVELRRAFAALYWAINLGFTIAPLAAGAIAGWSYTALFIGDAVTMAIYGVIVWVKVPESRPASSSSAASPTSFLDVVTDGVFLIFVCLATVTALLFHQSTLTLSVYLRDLGYSASTYGAIVAVNGVLIIVVQPALAGWAGRRGSTPVLAVAALACGLGMSLHGVGAAIAWQLAAVIVWTLGEIAQSAHFGAVVSTLAPPDARGRYQGMFGLAFALAAAAAPATGRVAMATLGPRGAWFAAAVLGAAAAVGFLATARGRAARGVI